MATAMLSESKHRSIKGFANSARGIAFQKVPLSKIYINTKFNIRDDAAYHADNMAELQESIRSAGMVFEPLKVMPIDHDDLSPELQKEMEGYDFTVMDGYRRGLCLQRLAEEDPAFGASVPVIITNKTGDAGVFKLIQLISGLQRQNFTALETARAFGAMIEDNDIQLTQQEVADAAGVQRTRVTQYLKLLKMPAEVQKMMNAGELNFTQARIIQQAPPDEGGKNWLEWAKAAKTLSNEVLNRKIRAQYHLDADERTIEVKEKEKVQRVTVKTIKAKDYLEKYLPEFKKRAAEAKKKGDEPAAALWQYRMDALAWFFCNTESLLSKDLKDWENEQTKQEEAEKKTKEAQSTEQKFISALVDQIYAFYNKAPDDETKPRPTLVDCYAAIRADLKVRMDKAKEEKKSVQEHFGFDFPGVEPFMEKVIKAVKENEAKKKKARELKATKDAWKLAFTSLRNPDLSPKDKAAFSKDLSEAIDDLKRVGVDPAEHEKAFLATEEKAKADKAEREKKKAKSTNSVMATNSN